MQNRTERTVFWLNKAVAIMESVLACANAFHVSDVIRLEVDNLHNTRYFCMAELGERNSTCIDRRIEYSIVIRIGLGLVVHKKRSD